jgi:F-type H+-transporting ATPase subunit gamma
MIKNFWNIPKILFLNIIFQDMALKGGIKFLRKRIRAVRNIKKLTKAMKTVASVRLRKAQPALLNSREFIEDLEKIFPISHEPKEDFLNYNVLGNTSGVAKTGEVKRIFIVLGSFVELSIAIL